MFTYPSIVEISLFLFWNHTKQQFRHILKHNLIIFVQVKTTDCFLRGFCHNLHTCRKKVVNKAETVPPLRYSYVTYAYPRSALIGAES